eukprot:1557249-Rhodomonas_salina.3
MRGTRGALACESRRHVFGGGRVRGSLAPNPRYRLESTVTPLYCLTAKPASCRPCTAGFTTSSAEDWAGVRSRSANGGCSAWATRADIAISAQRAGLQYPQSPNLRSASTSLGGLRTLLPRHAPPLSIVSRSESRHPHLVTGTRESNTREASEGKQQPCVRCGHPAVVKSVAWHRPRRNVGEVKPNSRLGVVGVERVGACGRAHTLRRKRHSSKAHEAER